MNASEFQILCPVTAEVAGSSPVVPAIHSKRLIGIGGIQKGCRRDTNMCPFCTPFSIAIRSRLRLRWANRAGSANSDKGLSGGSVRPQPKMAGMRRADEQTSASEPHSDFQGEGGFGRHQGRKDTFGVGAGV